MEAEKGDRKQRKPDWLLLALTIVEVDSKPRNVATFTVGITFRLPIARKWGTQFYSYKKLNSAQLKFVWDSRKKSTCWCPDIIVVTAVQTSDLQNPEIINLCYLKSVSDNLLHSNRKCTQKDSTILNVRMLVFIAFEDIYSQADNSNKALVFSAPVFWWTKIRKTRKRIVSGQHSEAEVYLLFFLKNKFTKIQVFCNIGNININ